VPTAPPDWIALRVEVPRALADAVANFLIERGSPGILSEEVDPDRTRLEGALPEDVAGDATAALGGYLRSLAEIEPGARLAAVETTREPALDWTAVYRRHHRPLRIGERLLVAPPWDVPPAPDREVLVIEPGMAFGTGQHATTRACLEAIEAAMAHGPVHSALDVGTGSGILALALARLGVDRVVALDTDPSVLPLARANLARNGAPRVALVCGSAAAVRGAFDLVVANLLADSVVAEAPSLTRAVAAGGQLIVSGLLEAQAGAVRAGYAGWRVTGTRSEDAWRTLTLARDG
jgi:ribosomal protein L11 methyltransferase